MNLSNRKKEVLLFGAGKAGKRSFEACSDRYSVKAFIDNNDQIHGQHLLGIPIISPSEIAGFTYDEIHISSMYQSQILRQLTQDLGIEKSKIKLVDKDIMYGLFEKHYRPKLFVLSLIGLYLLSVYVTTFFII